MVRGKSEELAARTIAAPLRTYVLYTQSARSRPRRPGAANTNITRHIFFNRDAAVSLHVRVRHGDREVLAEAPVRLDYRAARGDELAEQPLDRARRRRAALLEHLPNEEGARALVGRHAHLFCLL